MHIYGSIIDRSWTIAKTPLLTGVNVSNFIELLVESTLVDAYRQNLVSAEYGKLHILPYTNYKKVP